MLQIYHKRDPLITKAENETYSNKKKKIISSRNRRKLIHNPYISTKYWWKVGDIFNVKCPYYDENICHPQSTCEILKLS